MAGEGFATPRDFGALAGGADDAKALQGMITDICTRGNFGPVLMAGEFRTGTTLTAPVGTCGMVFEGAGISVFHNTAPHAYGSPSVLAWSGVEGGAMFDMDGVLGFDFAHMTFLGRPSGVGSRAGYFWKAVYDPSSGAGEATFDSCSFEDFDTVFKFGEGGTIGSGGTVWQKCQASDCGVFLETTNNNAVGLSFNEFSGNRISTVMKGTEGGGGLSVRTMNLAQCNTEATGTTGWLFDLNPGAGAGAILFDGIRIEQGTRHFLRVNQSGLVSVRGLEEPQDNTAQTLFKIEGATVIVCDSRLVSHDATNPTFLLSKGDGGAPGLLVLERVHFQVESWVFAEWIQWTDVNQHTNVVMRDCTYGSGRLPLPNFDSRLVSGCARHVGQTTGASAVNSGFSGNGVGSYYNTLLVPTDTAWGIFVNVLGRQTDGSVVATFKRHATVKNVGGTVSIVGSVETIGTDINPSSWGGPTVVVDTGRAGIRTSLVGAAATTIDWTVEYRAAGR
jgi:hypothetical protein